MPSWSWLAGPSFQLHLCPWEPKLWLHQRSWLHQRRWSSPRDLRLSCPWLLPLSSSLLTIHECPLKPTSNIPHPRGLLQGPPPCITPPSPCITPPPPCLTPPPSLLFLEHLLISTSKSLLSHHLSDAGPHTPVFSP